MASRSNGNRFDRTAVQREVICNAKLLLHFRQIELFEASNKQGPCRTSPMTLLVAGLLCLLSRPVTGKPPSWQSTASGHFHARSNAPSTNTSLKTSPP